MMRTMKPAGFLVVVAVALAMAGCRGGGDGLPMLPANSFEGSPLGCEGITTNLELSSERGSGYVYELEHREVTEKAAVELAKRFGFEESPEYDADLGAFVVRNNSSKLEISEYEIFYNRTDLESSSVDFLSDEEMISRAEEQLKSWGMFPKANMRISVEKVGDDLMEVVFRFADIPTPLLDAGSIVVLFTPEGEISALFNGWQEPKKTREYPFISEQEAWERLQKCEAYVSRHAYEVRITKVRLAYEAVPIHIGYRVSFDYLFPVYVFETDENSDLLLRAVALVPAVTDEYLIPHVPSNESHGSARD